MPVHTYDTHWVTGNTKTNTKQPHVAGYYNAEISLHKAVPFSIQHLYCLKYKIPFLEQDLIFLYSRTSGSIH